MTLVRRSDMLIYDVLRCKLVEDLCYNDHGAFSRFLISTMAAAISVVVAYALSSVCYAIVLVLALFDASRTRSLLIWNMIVFAAARVAANAPWVVIDPDTTSGNSNTAVMVLSGLASVAGTLPIMYMVQAFLQRWLASVCGSSHDVRINERSESNHSGFGSGMRRLRWTIGVLYVVACIFALLGVVGSISRAQDSGASKARNLIAAGDWGFFLLLFTLFCFGWSYRQRTLDWPSDLMAGVAKKAQLRLLLLANGTLVLALLLDAVRISAITNVVASAYMGLAIACCEMAASFIMLWPGMLAAFEERMLLPMVDDVHITGGSHVKLTVPKSAYKSSSNDMYIDSVASSTQTTSSNSNKKRQRPGEKGIHPVIGHENITIVGMGSGGGAGAAFADHAYNPYVLSFQHKMKQKKSESRSNSVSHVTVHRGVASSNRAERSYEQEVLQHQQRYAEQRRFFAEVVGAQADENFSEGYGYGVQLDDIGMEGDRSPTNSSHPLRDRGDMSFDYHRSNPSSPRR
ncbi:hypothetical protein THASP1DRAFT_22218 [Thamnocephalis sphaerospora]|uniref:Transmembrane protein n=1 Tax=Thamnocephalis sphaerospora TaxID=78915 RepID=A0A4V1IX69_9FUNG|nr:hypothetical protein THASP1DRAFT_22218 [Thamnocephalis sphaerospora]|eukprot:RKP10019.1 hypothetical protein THASP1DRAFT_22218 [Thamnocephalis sphaerospora]